jgi:hypothetical protein
MKFLIFTVPFAGTLIAIGIAWCNAYWMSPWGSQTQQAADFATGALELVTGWWFLLAYIFWLIAHCMEDK